MRAFLAALLLTIAACGDYGEEGGQAAPAAVEKQPERPVKPSPRG